MVVQCAGGPFFFKHKYHRCAMGTLGGGGGWWIFRHLCKLLLNGAYTLPPGAVVVPAGLFRLVGDSFYWKGLPRVVEGELGFDRISHLWYPAPPLRKHCLV